MSECEHDQGVEAHEHAESCVMCGETVAYLTED